MDSRVVPRRDFAPFGVEVSFYLELKEEKAMLKSLMELREEAVEQLKQLQNSQELNDFKVAYLGKKGKLTTILRQMGKLPAEDRPKFGQAANEIRQFLEENLALTLEVLSQKEQTVKLQSEKIDITLPGFPFAAGTMHPIT